MPWLNPGPDASRGFVAFGAWQETLPAPVLAGALLLGVKLLEAKNHGFSVCAVSLTPGRAVTGLGKRSPGAEYPESHDTWPLTQPTNRNSGKRGLCSLFPFWGWGWSPLAFTAPAGVCASTVHQLSARIWKAQRRSSPGWLRMRLRASRPLRLQSL